MAGIVNRIYFYSNGGPANVSNVVGIMGGVHRSFHLTDTYKKNNN